MTSIACDVRGVVLVGGGSRRMGRPKQLLARDGRTLAERAVELLAASCGEVVLAGAGEVPAALAACARVPDAPGGAGPIAGILGALASGPEWSLVVACDQARLDAAAIAWLLGERLDGVRAVLPRLAEARVEPMLALYSREILPELVEIAGGADRSLQRLVGRAGVATPTPPSELRAAWTSYDTPEAWRDLERGATSA